MEDRITNLVIMLNAAVVLLKFVVTPVVETIMAKEIPVTAAMVEIAATVVTVIVIVIVIATVIATAEEVTADKQYLINMTGYYLHIIIFRFKRIFQRH